MEWIKASERTPQSDSPQYHFRLNGWNKINGNFFDDGNGGIAFGIHGGGAFEDYVIEEKDFDKIEWLDESASSIPLDTVVYVPVSVEDELPDADEGLFIVKLPGGWIEVFYDKHYSFHMEFTDCSGITHWLKKTTIGELKK